MDAELQAYKDSVAAVGKAVYIMNDCRKKLHDAIESVSTTTANQVSKDISALSLTVNIPKGT